MISPVEFAKIVLSQISNNTKACIGLSEVTAISDREVRFKVRITNQRNYIYIKLNGLDLYDVRQTLVRGGKETTKYEASDVYCDNLSEVVYRLGSTGYGANEGWLASVGIEKV